MRQTQKVRWAVVAAGLALGLSLGGCGRSGVPEPGSSAYRKAISAFYVGLAALDVGAFDRAEQALKRVTVVAPKEPAAWANLGLLKLRMGQYGKAERALKKAHSLAPKNSRVETLLGLLESRQGRSDEAIQHFRLAAGENPGNLRARFAWVQEVERQQKPGSEARARSLVDSLLKDVPGNLVLLLEQARLAAKAGDAAGFAASAARLGRFAPGWPPAARQQFQAMEAARTDLRQAGIRSVFLRNVLEREPAFQRDMRQLRAPAADVDEPIERPLRLAALHAEVAPPDSAMTFAAGPAAGGSTGGWGWTALAVVWPDTGMTPVVWGANARRVQRLDRPGSGLPFPGGKPGVSAGPHGVTALDWNNDFRTDLALAGAGGVRLFLQNPAGGFADSTGALGLSDAVRNGTYTGSWAVDLEMDGDLDLVLGCASGTPVALRNNGDGTALAVHPFEGVSGLRAFAWVDLDGDGDPDAALVDGGGRLRIFDNERDGRFVLKPAPEGVGETRALAVGDLNGDGVLDLAAVEADGWVLGIFRGEAGAPPTVRKLVRWPDGPLGEGPVQIFLADLDNNGALDVVVSANGRSRVWLGEGNGRYRPCALPEGPLAQGAGAEKAGVPGQFRPYVAVQAAADLTRDGRVDLVGLSGTGTPVLWTNQATAGYHWQAVRPRGHTVGDERINSYAIGGWMQARAGLLVQARPVEAPVVHFGLGRNPRPDVVRIVWPNGTAQAEFDMAGDQAVMAEQRLKGSCPWVFAYDGHEMRFVTDFLWRSPLGMRINAQKTAGVMQTEDRVLIRGDQLVPKDGVYDIRITAELWETHFFDTVWLMAVDHPRGTWAWVDERFSRTPDLATRLTGRPRPVARAVDDRGTDVTALVRKRDGRYVDTFGRGRYQGVTRDHYLEVTLGKDARGPGWLLAYGWTHPTDSSINVAIGQGRAVVPKGLSLEASDGSGGWRTVYPDLGFPAGKNKTVMIRLPDSLKAGARLRLRTNLEVYWDWVAWAPDAHGKPMRTHRIDPSVANLHYRGFSVVRQANPSSPELPEYGRIATTAPMWRDLTGYYTRYGDVRELLARVDDRYVIMNAGDELSLRFPAPPGPPAGWVRDFVLVGDGWVKDGDFNTAYSSTVRPLPEHGHPEYSTPPGALEDDPVYRLHPKDWQVFQTRYVTPRAFGRGLRPPGIREDRRK